jgi:putative ABC transport system permease protein
MISNYLKTAWRIMLRQKAYSAINIVGLSVGIAATLVIASYITDELSYDKFHHDAADIYRLGFSGSLQGNEFNMAVSPARNSSLRDLEDDANELRRQKFHGKIHGSGRLQFL